MKSQIAGLHSQTDWFSRSAVGPESAFLTSPQEVLLLVVYEPHFEKFWFIVMYVVVSFSTY